VCSFYSMEAENTQLTIISKCNNNFVLSSTVPIKS
jgi:hypothetical protein